MRILHIHKFFDQTGGAEQYLHRLIAQQADEGHEVHVLSTRSTRNQPSDDTKYFIHRYDFSRAEGTERDAKKGLAFLWNKEARTATERVLRDVKPDVVHLHNIYHHLSSSILGPIRRARIPCVQTLHDLKLACPNYKMFTEGSVCERCKGGKYWNPIVHHCLSSSTMGNTLAAVEMALTKATQAYEKTVSRFICPSSFYADKMREWGEPATRLVVLPNPADVSAQPGRGGGGFLLFAGRLSEEKGVETLIRASARVPSLPLRIAGTGRDEERLRHIVQTLGATHIRFLGFVPPSELVSLRAVAEAVVAPSVWYENSPLSVLEALGEGVPVIGSNIGGIPELITDGSNGLLANAGDVASWVEALERFQSLSPAARRGMGERGRTFVQTRHDWAGHLAGLARIYADAGAR